MAKWGEGDPRWIVEERPDATNVNNWHWTEKNATAWSKDRLKAIFNDFVIAENGIECKITEIDQIDGEATANNRKGKLIFFYEWNLVLKWTGELPDAKESFTGKATIPNLSEENDLEDIEITITVETSNTESEKLKLFMYDVGRNSIRNCLGTYVKELKEAYSEGLILPKKEESAKIKPDTVATITSGFNRKMDIQKFVPSIPTDNKTAEIGLKIDVQTLEFKVGFQCRSNDLYDALTKIEMVQAFTRGLVKLDPKKGGEFILFGGTVEGKFEELVPNTKIIQSWRLKQWPVGHFSTVVMDIEEKDDHTELQITQTGVPTHEMETIRLNWERYYWNSIKQTFGFGSFLI